MAQAPYTALFVYYQAIGACGDDSQDLVWSTLRVRKDQTVIFQAPRSFRGSNPVCRTDPVSNDASVGFRLERDSSPRRRKAVAGWSKDPLSRGVLFIGMHPALRQYFASVLR